MNPKRVGEFDCWRGVLILLVIFWVVFHLLQVSKFRFLTSQDTLLVYLWL